MLLEVIAKRILFMIPTLFGIAVLVFFLSHLAPGDPAMAALGLSVEGSSKVDPAAVARVREELGLDRPLVMQFLSWLGGALVGDFGRSYTSPHTVAELIWGALPVTLMLLVGTMLVASVVGIGLGIVSAVSRGRLGDYLARFIAILGVSTPTFWFALVLLLLLAFTYPIFPMGGGPAQHGLKAMVLPILAIALHPAALIARMTRSSMLEVMSQDYVRTALAKGLSPWRVIMVHALRNAINPVITVIGFQFGNLIGGAVAVEVIFSLPGLGSLLIGSIYRSDMMVLQGIVLVIGVGFAFANLVVDLLYMIIDPRIGL